MEMIFYLRIMSQKFLTMSLSRFSGIDRSIKLPSLSLLAVRLRRNLTKRSDIAAQRVQVQPLNFRLIIFLLVNLISSQVIFCQATAAATDQLNIRYVPGQ